MGICVEYNIRIENVSALDIFIVVVIFSYIYCRKHNIKLTDIVKEVKTLLKPKRKRCRTQQVWYEEYNAPTNYKYQYTSDNTRPDGLTFKNLVLTKKYIY